MTNINFNLLDEQWIPVFRADGTRDWIAPHQIAETENPPVQFAGRLPDFNSAYLQFMVGLLQTAYAPDTEDEHLSTYREGLDPDELQSLFSPYHKAFYLVHEDEDHPRFFQTPLHTADDPMSVPIVRLLHEDGSSKKAADFNPLVQRDCFGLREAAAVLISRQVEGSGNGGGKYSSLRGCGPVTVFLQCEQSLWKTLWLNVIPVNQMQQLHDKSSSSNKIFSWMHDDLIASWQKDGEGQPVEVDDVAPEFVFWSVSKNIRLLVDDDDGKVRSVLRTNSNKFTKDEGWRHPLTPYLPDGSGGVDAQTADTNFDIRDWVIVRYGLDDDHRWEYQPKPLERFETFYPLQEVAEQEGDIIRVRMIGPDYNRTKVAKLQGYVDQSLPLFVSASGFDQQAMKNKAGSLVNAYDEMVYKTRKKVYKINGDGTPFQNEFENQLGIWFEHESQIVSALYRWGRSGKLQSDDKVLKGVLYSFKDRFLDEYSRLVGLRDDGSGRRLTNHQNQEVSMVRQYDSLDRWLNVTIYNSLDITSDDKEQEEK